MVTGNKEIFITKSIPNKKGFLPQLDFVTEQVETLSVVTGIDYSLM